MVAKMCKKEKCGVSGVFTYRKQVLRGIAS